jgi:cytochrome c biogenesis protein CcdA
VPSGLLGQFLIGGLLGAVWVPCTGPTLAAAITLASRGEDLGRAGTVMVAFGLGAALPLLLVAYGSRRALVARHRVLEALGRLGTPVMGAALLVIGVLTLSGLDKRVETQVLDRMPEWLVALTTRF